MILHKAVTCPVCGCLCDDLEVTVDRNRIVDINNACALSESKFLGYNSEHRIAKPLLREKGKLLEVSLEKAIEKAAEILTQARYPILYGWSSTSCEAIRVGLELAEELGGIIDNTSTVCHGPSSLAIQDVGIPSCTLGQVRHRADLIIYWGSDPWSSHPRHIERYTSFSDGRFEKSEWKSYVSKTKASSARKKVDRAMKRLLTREHDECLPPQNESTVALLKKGRKLIVVDVRKTRTAEIADCFLQIEPNRDYEVLQCLRALIRDIEVDVDEVGGIPLQNLEELADVMVNCEFGVLFFGLGLTMSQGKSRNVDAALSLIRDLNLRTKFAIMPMRGHFNVSGADTVFTWQTGYPYAVDFSQGYPRYNPGETSIIDILEKKESDAALIVASDPVANFPREAAEQLTKKPLIVIDPHMNASAHVADVVIPSALVGIEASGTAYRMDHVPLPLKKLVNPAKNMLSDQRILSNILEQVRKIKATQSRGTVK